MKEIWKDLVGYEGIYKVSNLGNVYSVKREVPINGGHKYVGGHNMINVKNTAGYIEITLRGIGKALNKKVHRAVGEAFIPNKYNKPFINHKNGIKTDNRVENLEWVTEKENVRHAIDTGLKEGWSGTDNPKAKLNYKLANKIREEYAVGDVKQSDLAMKYGVVQSSISQIILNRRYPISNN